MRVTTSNYYSLLDSILEKDYDLQFLFSIIFNVKYYFKTSESIYFQ